MTRQMLLVSLVSTALGVGAARPVLAESPRADAIVARAVETALAALGDDDDRADDLYDRARDLIEEGRYDRALAELDRILSLNSGRMDAALYWKAYSLAKLGQRADA